MRGPMLLAPRALRASRVALSASAPLSSAFGSSAASSTATRSLASAALPTVSRRGVASLERFFRTELVSGRTTVPLDSYAFVRDSDGRVLGFGPKETVKLPKSGLLSRMLLTRADHSPVHFILITPMRFMLTDVPVTTADDIHLSLVASVQVRVSHPQLAFEMASNVQSTFPTFAARALTSAAASAPASSLENASTAEDPSSIPALTEAQETLSALLEPLGFACESFLVHGAAPQRDSAHAAAARLAHAQTAIRARAYAQLELARARADGVAGLLSSIEDPSLRATLSSAPALAEFVLLGPRAGEAAAAAAATAGTGAATAAAAEAALLRDVERGLAASASAATAAAAAAVAAAEDPAARAARVGQELDRVGGSVASAFLRRNEAGDASGDVATEGGFALSPDVTAAAPAAAPTAGTAGKAGKA